MQNIELRAGDRKMMDGSIGRPRAERRINHTRRPYTRNHLRFFYFFYSAKGNFNSVDAGEDRKRFRSFSTIFTHKTRRRHRFINGNPPSNHHRKLFFFSRGYVFFLSAPQHQRPSAISASHILFFKYLCYYPILAKVTKQKRKKGNIIQHVNNMENGRGGGGRGSAG
jgi:hypothetical protein